MSMPMNICVGWMVVQREREREREREKKRESFLCVWSNRARDYKKIASIFFLETFFVDSGCTFWIFMKRKGAYKKK